MKSSRILAFILSALLVLGLVPAMTAGAEGIDYAALGMDENLRFLETRHITVEIYDRAVDDGPAPDTSVYAQFIKDGMLEKHNVEVEFVRVARWTEPQDIANLLVSGSAPDICYTYQYPVIQTYGEMGGVIDLSGYLTDYEAMFPNLFNLLSEELIFWNKDPVDGHLWAVEANRVAAYNQLPIVHVREDWMAKLNIEEPTNLEEFEAMLVAFQENAELLLGEDADKLIPFEFSYDVGFRWLPIIDSLTADNFTDRERFIYGSDERKLLWPAAKETARILNKWYNMGLTWDDFAMYSGATLGSVEDDMLKAGYVGAFVHNFDYPYRNGADSIHNALKRLVGEDAAFIGVNLFPNETGEVVRWAPAKASDRKIFFPSTNDEPIASLLYLDWISTFENRYYLQTGEEGITHEVTEDGAIRMIGVSGENKMNSVNNIDYTMTINGVDYGDNELQAKSEALNYDNTDPSYVIRIIHIARDFGRPAKNVNVGAIEAEAGIMQVLNTKRDAFLGRSISAPVDRFDEIWDLGMKDYLGSGGQAIIDERTAKWEEFFGDVDFLP